MENIDRLNSYLDLLKIRQNAYHRNVIITVGLFLLAMLSTTGELFLTEWNVRSVFILAIFDVLFASNFIMAWARLEITKQNIELVNNIRL